MGNQGQAFLTLLSCMLSLTLYSPRGEGAAASQQLNPRKKWPFLWHSCTQMANKALSERMPWLHQEKMTAAPRGTQALPHREAETDPCGGKQTFS